MPRAYYSSVLNQPADQVWGLVRDFNKYPNYIDGVTQSVIEDDKQGDEIGAVRRFCYRGSWLRQRLTDHSDAKRSFSYSGMEPFQFPAQDATHAPAAVDYTGTLRLTPIIDSDRTFIEWYVEFDCHPKDVQQWDDLLMDMIPQWVESLRRALLIACETTSDTSATQLTEDSAQFRSLMRFYGAEGRYSASGNAADRNSLLNTLHPDIVLHQAESLPYGGVWRGREAFGQWLDAFVQAWTQITPTDPVFHACGDNMLISTVTMRASARSTGAQIVMPMCQVIRFSDNLPIEWRNFAWDTAKMVHALGSIDPAEKH
jgi:ketosteroid isomerase-like protein